MDNRYAIIENNVVVNLATASLEFAQEQGWIEAPDYVDNQPVAIGWSYVDGQFIPPVVDYTEQNKQQAQLLLSTTDWTCTVDINNPNYSNPYLGNQDAFLAYRSQVRAIAVNPPTTPAIFPEVPQEVWVTV